MGHGAGLGLGHSDADDSVSTRGLASQTVGHKGATHHGRAVSAHSRSSHLTAAHHALAHHHVARSSKAATPAERALPPGIELNVDRGKAVPPDIESKVGPNTPDIDTPAERALPPGQELSVDRGERAAPGTVSPDNDIEATEPSSDESGQD